MVIRHAIERRKRSAKGTNVYFNGILIPDKKLRKEMARLTYPLPQPGIYVQPPLCRQGD
jgi:hypothetical protein